MPSRSFITYLYVHFLENFLREGAGHIFFFQIMLSGSSIKHLPENCIFDAMTSVLYLICLHISNTGLCRWPQADHAPIFSTHHPCVNWQRNSCSHMIIHLKSDWLHWIWRTYHLQLYYILLDQKIILLYTMIPYLDSKWKIMVLY
jgi:hypothetical protein